MGIRNKLLEVIGDKSINQWARDNDLPPQTVHEWINKDRTPRSGGLDTLIKNTGIPKDWWLYGIGYEPKNPISNPASNAVINSSTSNGVKNFITLPKYALQTMPDRTICSDQIVNYLAFDKEWLEGSLSMYDNALALIRVKDDSMEPTLKADDLILAELSHGRVNEDSIYVLNYDGYLKVRRIQRGINGSLLMTPDNGKYKEQEIDRDDIKDLPVVGKVIWYGRRI